MVEKSSSGAGEEVELTTEHDAIPIHRSPDDRYIVYSRNKGNGTYDTWLMPTSGERKPLPFLESPFDKMQVRVSPDSRYVAYSTNESGTYQVVVQTFPDSNGGKWIISGDGGTEPKWRRDGRELYYLAFDGKLMMVPITYSPSFKAGKPEVLFQTTLALNRAQPGRDRRYDVAPDGRFLFIIPASSAETNTVTAMVNWDAALKK
jgi:Tol biopolymer transport system component